ncbi:MAG: hypothetical protein GC185_01540 [Alphaproteobacteria bacterium]|nr:hypothetical protein [Alphaproteobacteria bacterium]
MARRTPDHKLFLKPEFRQQEPERHPANDGAANEGPGETPEKDLPAIPAGAPSGKKDKPAGAKPDVQEEFSRAAGNDNLPRWKLADLYPGIDSKELAGDMAQVDKAAAAFRETYEGTIGYLSGPELGEAVALYEAIENLRGKISCYLELLKADSLANFPKVEPVAKWLESSADAVGFFEGEILEMKEKDLLTKLGAPALAHYAPWIAHLRAGSVEGIDGDVSALAQDFQNTNREAWGRLYHETLAAVRVTLDGKKITLDEADDEIASAETLERRREVRKAIGDALDAEGKRMALIYNTIVKDDLLTAKLYKYARPDEGENEQNGIAPEVVDTMFETVKHSYARLSHRFYRWKAEQHGVEIIERARLGMPLPDAPKDDSGEYGFDDARKIILRAYKRFSPKFARIGKQFFDKQHIDAQLRADKETGAFAMPVGPDTFPFVMLSYAGGVDDLITLGHELGHGVHQVLAQKARGLFLSEMSTAVSETASIFAEMLVFEELLAKEKDPARRKDLLKDKVEGMILNGLQQLSYYDFERRVHEERKNGELSVDEISDIWVETQKEYFGPSVEMDGYDRNFWMVVPHFFDTPFYVYSYSFAQILVSGLYQSYKAAEQEGPEAREEFVQNYIDLLETGITRNLFEMCQPFDLDPETPEFWEKGLSLMDKYLNELENFDMTPAAKPKAGAKGAKKKGPSKGK